jgi:hypothetical protein
MTQKLIAGLIAVSMAVFAVGCWPPEYAEDEYLEALPNSDDLVVKIGAQDVVDGTAQDAELVPIDPYADCPECCIVEDGGEEWFVDGEVYQMTKSAKRYVNGSLVTVFTWIYAIVAYPYSEETELGYIWGPWQESLSRIRFRFAMDKIGPDEFEFRLEGQNINETADVWTPVLYGKSTAGDTPHHPVGELTVDFDAIHAIDVSDPSPETGVITYEYDVRDFPYIVDVDFDHFAAEDDLTLDASYSYRRLDSDMAGYFSFTAVADVWPEDGPDGVPESFEVESEWDSTGEGVGMAELAAGSLAEDNVVEYVLNECWADADGLYYATYEQYEIDYLDETPSVSEVTCGSASHCPLL